MKKNLMFNLLFLLLGNAVLAQTTLLPAGSSWKYRDNGSNLRTSWRASSYNDASWASGNAQLGYGDGDEATVVSYGSNSSKKYTTTYFRKALSISNVSAFTNYTLKVKRDDGVVVYINGTERFRSNMPTGTISYTTKASSDASDDGNTWFSSTIANSAFANGNNVIAVEIHQRTASSSDISFDLELTATAVDVTPPVVNTYSPSDNSTSVLRTSNLVLTFSENIQKGTGNILIKEGGTTTQTIAVTSGTVTVSGATLTINPSDFSFGAAVNVEMAAGTVKDLANNNFAGILNTTTWNFGVESAPIDSTAPVVNSYSPSDNSSSVLRTSNLVLTFSESIQKGTGNILIKEGGTTTQTIDVASGTVTVSGSTLTINPSDFSFGAAVNIEIAAGTIKDLANNNYAGISDATTWNFGVEAAPPADTIPPAISTLSPVDNATNVSLTSNLVITFSENIAKGSGNILIKRNGTTVQTIDVTSGSVTVAGAVVTIDPANLSYSDTFNIEMASGVFKDLNNNSFAGISNSTTWDFSTQAAPTGSQNLIVSGNAWKYLDNGSNQGTSWTASSFNDASWASGNSQLGYGDGDEATVVSYGSNSSAKYITTYFRKSINVSDPSQYSNFTLNVKRDDGIVLYVNGVERYRNNMPTGTISYTTAASTAIADDGATWVTSTLASSAFSTGTNVIAVEIHQNVGTSSDISFDCELTANAPGSTTLTRGPYLQMGTPSSVIIRWRSAAATDSRVSYGTSSSNLNNTVSDNASVTDHIVQLTGLNPNTVYYYSIGSSTQTLQGDANNYFRTSPVVGSTQKTRVWVVGDCGNNSTNQVNVRNQYHNYVGNDITDVWLLLGDNAYNGGLDNEYQNSFYNIYKDKMLKQAVLWPSPGNHDYNGSSTLQNTHNMPYYDMFSLPTSAQAGGVASNTEAFYSYNYANIHFLSLDSYGKESNTYRLYDTLGPQVVWIKQDLAADTSKWRVAYWHHPPYTMGSHNSDTETELINMRQNFIKILERYKVDLILTGHSHDYERSKLMKGHYGNEASFNASTHHLSSSSAKYDGSSNSCPYHKNQSNAHNGTVYIVAGSAGQLGGTQASFPHNAMYYSDATNGGSLVLEVEDNRLDGKWVCADGNIRDKFTMVKDVSKTTNLTIGSAQSTVLTASWVGNYSWNSGSQTTKSITVAPTVDTTYTVTDGVGCITDVFNITISSTLPKRSNFNPKGNSPIFEEPALDIYPNPFSNQTTIAYSTPFNGQVQLDVYDLKGQKVRSLVSKSLENGKYKYVLNSEEAKLTAGIYLVKLKVGETEIIKRISIIKG